MEAVKEYQTERAIIRIHPGKLSDEERRAVIEAGAKRFYEVIIKEQNERRVQAK